MTLALGDLLERIDELKPEATIYAVGGKHATCGSLAIAVIEPPDGSTPKGTEGMAYMLEVSFAKEARVWGSV